MVSQRLPSSVILLISVISLVFILACSAVSGVALPSSTPAIIGFDNACNFTGDDATFEGILHLPDSLYCSTGEYPDSCDVHLVSPDRSEYMVISIDMVTGDFDPEVNMMGDIPVSYRDSDFKVRTDDGQLYGEGDLVRVSGSISSTESYEDDGAIGQPKPCSLYDINRIEGLDQLTGSGSGAYQTADLSKAIAGGLVDATATGDGLSRVDLTLQSQSNSDLEIFIASGTVFDADSGSVQQMAAKQNTIVLLRSGSEVDLVLGTYCINMELDEPAGTDSFEITQAGASDDLVKLLNFSELRFAPERVQQFAVWTITDNPARDEYTGITLNNNDYYGTGPTDEEFEGIRTLFLSAGIEPGDYKAFSE